MRFTKLLIATLFGITAFVALSTSAHAAVPPLADILKDRVLGNEKAPITINEFASLTCGHCAHFHKDILPEVQKQLIDTGKVKLVFRDFPLDGAALKASALARCMPANVYFPFLKILYDRQATWATDAKPEEALAKLASFAGLDPETATACMTDTKILDALAQKRLDAEKTYKVNATPTFVFNNNADRIEGAQPVEKFVEAATKLAADSKAK